MRSLVRSLSLVALLAPVAAAQEEEPVTLMAMVAGTGDAARAEGRARVCGDLLGQALPGLAIPGDRRPALLTALEGCLRDERVREMGGRSRYTARALLAEARARAVEALDLGQAFAPGTTLVALQGDDPWIAGEGDAAAEQALSAALHDRLLGWGFKVAPSEPGAPQDPLASAREAGAARVLLVRRGGMVAGGASIQLRDVQVRLYELPTDSWVVTCMVRSNPRAMPGSGELAEERLSPGLPLEAQVEVFARKVGAAIADAVAVRLAQQHLAAAPGPAGAPAGPEQRHEVRLMRWSEVEVDLLLEALEQDPAYRALRPAARVGAITVLAVGYRGDLAAALERAVGASGVRARVERQGPTFQVTRQD